MPDSSSRLPSPSAAAAPARPRLDRRTLLLLLLASLVAGAAIWFAATGLPLKLWLAQGLEALRRAGPWWFFAAMALLPAIGFPLLPFALTAGPAFVPSLGAPTVVACAVLATACDSLLGYWLARGALRPLSRRVLARFGYAVPALPAGTAWQAVLIVRLAPGLPFWVQSYLLGVMRVPLLPYLVVSTAVPAGYLAAAIYGGDALLHGRTKVALLALAAFGLIAAGIQFWRRYRAASRPD